MGSLYPMKSQLSRREGFLRSGRKLPLDDHLDFDKIISGRVAEWLKAAVLKTASPDEGDGGSNPSPSAIYFMLNSISRRISSGEGVAVPVFPTTMLAPIEASSAHS